MLIALLDMYIQQTLQQAARVRGLFI